jgi:nucleoside 2-deoxyribosyltransferase
MNKQKVFLIHPVRNITPEFEDSVRATVEQLRREGKEVYDPAESTDQNGSSIEICRQNREAISHADYVAFMWDGQSQGCLFDLGMAFAMGKKVRAVIGCTPPMSRHKSFQNLVFEIEESEACRDIRQ